MKENRNLRILIYRVGSLGDTLIALPCFRAIRAQYPTAHISLLTNAPVNKKAPRVMDVLEQTGIIDEVLEYTIASRSFSKIFTLFSSLWKRNFDLAVYLVPARTWKISVRDFLFLKLSRAKKVIGIPFSKKDLYPRKLKNDLWEWEAERLARRIQPLITVSIEDPTVWSLSLTIEEKSAALHLLSRKEFPTQKWIAASVGTKADAKDWMESNWLELIKSIQKHYSHMGLVMLGCESDFERSERCLAKWPGPQLNLCGKTSPRISAAVLKEATLFVGHDSGPMHLAAVVGTPCVAVFAARNFPGQWFPKGGNTYNQILYHRTDCLGCGLEVCTHYAKKCILSISVKEVEEAIKKALKDY